jgi:hypothetical protein
MQMALNGEMTAPIRPSPLLPVVAGCVNLLDGELTPALPAVGGTSTCECSGRWPRGEPSLRAARKAGVRRAR